MGAKVEKIRHLRKLRACLASCQWDVLMFPQDKTVENMFGKYNYHFKYGLGWKNP